MIELHLLGIEGHKKTQQLRQNVLQAARALGSPVHLVAVTEIDELIRYNISGTPALIANDRILFERDVPSSEEVEHHLRQFLLNRTINWHMDTILVPVDFSDCSRRAYLYALELAKIYQAKVRLVHCYAPAFDPDQPVIVQPMQENFNIATDRLRKFSQLHPNEDEGPISVRTKVSYEAILGIAVEEIVRLTKTKEVSMVVMGTTGKHGVLENIFGSVSSSVSQNAHCPVLLVPKGSEFTPFKKVVYAANYESIDPGSFDKVLELAEYFQSSIHFIHVKEEDDHSNLLQEQILEALFSGRPPAVPITLENVQGASVVEGILAQCADKEADLAVVITKHRSFWNKLIHQSVSKKIALSTTLPLLVFHTDDQA
ncbi:MAG: universal stress protein [Bacteroidota bacterium]